MSANVETAAYANTPAWHKEGVVIDTDGAKGMTVEQALVESGLDWEVTKVPLFTYASLTEDDAPEGEPMEVAGRFGVQRQTDKKILGTVGGTWKPVQNTEGFQLVDDIVNMADGKTWIESAMALDGGKKVVVMVHIESDWQIAGEAYNQYLAFVNGHDGRTSVTAMTHDMRIVCSNTLDWAYGEAKETGRIVRVRHTAKATDRIKEAAHILGMRDKRSEELAKQGEWLVEQEISDAEFNGFLEALLPIDENANETPAATMRKNRREDVAGVYFNAKNLDPIRGTRWGALQAVAEYSDHGREFKTEDTMIKAQLGMAQASPLKSNAIAILSNKKIKPLVTA